MTDEPKVPPEPTTPNETPVKSTSPGAAPVEPPAKAPSTPSPKAPPPPPKPAVKPELWSGPLLDSLNQRYPGAVTEAVIFRKTPSLTLKKESLLDVCRFLKSEEGGGYNFLTDETAVDYPKREKRFEVIYHVYSFTRNERLRLKVEAGEGEKVPSVVEVWAAANWLEREVYDMFGIEYEGHPNLKRILLPDEWTGHPLRKDYDILRQDDSWVQTNLHIPSGQ